MISFLSISLPRSVSTRKSFETQTKHSRHSGYCSLGSLLLVLLLIVIEVAYVDSFSSPFKHQLQPYQHSIHKSCLHFESQKSGIATGATTTQLFSTADDSSNVKASSASVSKVAVTGATGRTGSKVVETLLSRQMEVVALVRDLEKAQEVLPSSSSMLKIQKVDLTNSEQVTNALQGCDATIWCATGFAEAPPSSSSSEDDMTWFQKLKRMVGLESEEASSSAAPSPPSPEQSIDAIGLPIVAKAMLDQMTSSTSSSSSTLSSSTSLPKVVMLSSAGVTRPSWNDEKKKKLAGCADIPIVRLNPFGILDIKAASEETLRRSGVPYVIVRPTGLNDDWPIGSRPIFSQGDVAVGRIHRADVATILCDTIFEQQAEGKTFEVCTIAGYAPVRISSDDNGNGNGNDDAMTTTTTTTSIGPALSRLVRDNISTSTSTATSTATSSSSSSSNPLTEDQIEMNFALLQQLLPGEVQDAAKLAMGQTYEQLDQGETGRLGERGTENAEAAAPQPTSGSG